jgi:hypothetical protein
MYDGTQWELLNNPVPGWQLGKAATVASASTAALPANQNNVTITGTATITSLGSNASLSTPFYLVQFSGALTLTYNATSLILPGAANITTAANDFAIFEYLGSGNWLCTGYFPASGQPAVAVAGSSMATGKILVASGSIPTGTTTWDISIPSDASEIEVEILDFTATTGGGGFKTQYKVGGTTVTTGYTDQGLFCNNSTVGAAADSGSAWLPGVLPTSAPAYHWIKISGVQNGFRKKLIYTATAAANNLTSALGDCGANTGLISDLLITTNVGAGNITGGTYRVYKIK